MKDEVYEPYTRSDETFTCFNCGIPNLSSGLFDTVLGEPAQLQTTGESHSSIKSSDVPESSFSSASYNISDISSIHNSTLESDSSFFNQGNRVPCCSSPSKKTPKKLHTNNVRLSSLNIQSVMSAKKKPSFWNFMDHVDTDIICGCETWLNPSINDSEILPGNSPYNAYRKDRADGYGGSLLRIRNDIISEPVDITTNCDIIFRNWS